MTAGKSTTDLKLSTSDAAAGRIPLRLRLKAWWDGYELAVPDQAPKSVATPKREHQVRAPETKLPWDDQRIGLVQEVWGAGFDRPGGSDDVLNLLKPCCLDPSMSVLEIGAGLGGGTRAVCREFGIWISGFEGNAELARVGQSLSEMAGLGKKAAIAHTPLNEVELKSGSYDIVFARESFVDLPDKTRLLHTVFQSLKPKGQLLFTDYVLASPHADDRTLQAWRNAEPGEPAPWAVSDYVDTLKDLDLDIRIKEDRTDHYISAIKRAWAEFMHAGAQDGRLASYGTLAIDEADVWTKRINALEGKGLRVYRFHAIKSGATRTLSDW